MVFVVFFRRIFTYKQIGYSVGGNQRSYLLINLPMDDSLLRKEFSMKGCLPTLGLLCIAKQIEKRGQKLTVIDFVAEAFTGEKLFLPVCKRRYKLYEDFV